MPQGLDVYFMVFAVVLAVDSIANLTLWRFTKNKMFMMASFAWVANFFNFAMHGIAKNHDELTLIAHSLFYITILCLVSVLCDVTNQRFPFKKYAMLGFGVTTFSIFLYTISESYKWSVLMLDIMICIPPIIYGYKVFKLQNIDISARVLSFTLICVGLHFLDYPFLYNHPTLSIYGFSLAFLFSIGVSIILPTVIFRYISNVTRIELEQILEDRTKKLIDRTKMLELANEKLGQKSAS